MGGSIPNGKPSAFPPTAVAGHVDASFFRAGTLVIRSSEFENNQATAGTGGNDGNDQGMPGELPTVSGCGTSFKTNSAVDTAGSDIDNSDTYGTRRAELTDNCDPLFQDRFRDGV